ncbi:MAG: DUF748 domain-containing protein [Desulfobulbaceae bacterium]|nr:DUF748 domain-containing protein [Desulfobulbaceae bacterium]
MESHKDKTWSVPYFPRSLWRKWRGLSRLQRWTIIAAGSLLLYTVFGFWLLPAIVRAQLEKKLSQALQRQTTVREVKINPYTLKAAVNGFQVLDPAGAETFVSFDALEVNLQAVSLFKRAVIVKSFSLVNPHTRIILNRDRSFNFSDLLPASDEPAKAGEKEEEEEEEGSPLLFSINNINLSGGGIDFEDRVQDAAHRVTDLHIALPFLSNLPYEIEIFTQPAFEGTVNGAPFSMLGESKPFYQTRHSEIDFNFPDIDLTNYLDYLPENLNFTVKNGRLDLDLSLAFMLHEGDTPAIKIEGTTSLREVRVVDRLEQPLLSFPELTVQIDRAHLLRREFYLAGILWREPEIFMHREEDGQFNLARLIAPAAGGNGKDAGETSSGAFLLEAAAAAVEGGIIHFTDRTVSGPMQTTLQPVNLRVNDFSTGLNRLAGYNLELSSESGEQVSVDGTFSLNPLVAAADVEAVNVRPDKYRPYYEHALAAELAAEELSAAAHIGYAGADSSLLVSGLEVKLGGFSMTVPDGKDMIAVPDFSIQGAEINLRDKTVTVDGCTGREAVIPVTRRADGTISLRDFLAPAPPATASAGEPDDESGTDPDAVWQILVKTLDFSDFKVTFIDQTPEEQVELALDQLRLTAENISTGPGEEGSVALDLRLNESGTVKVSGGAVLSPLALQLEVDLDDLPLKSVQPYVEQQLNIIMADGRGAVEGRMILDSREDEGIGFAFMGDVRSSGFSALDAGQGEKLLNWKEIVLQGLDVQTAPLRIAAEEILVDGLNAFVSRSADGVLNLNTIVRENTDRPEQQEAPATEKAPPEVKINQVRLADCRVDFDDRSVTPRFTTSLQDINGGIKGLSSSRDVMAEINITAALDQHSPVKLTGSIHPWQEFFTDITAEFNDIELSPVSPYAIKFIGYPLTRGKLNLDLHYLIEGTKLSSRNRAFIDQISLGDRVPNETAVDLPVQLAISLLKNRQGEISLNIPVSGELDDPEFSVAGVVVKILYNLVVKAATSPFSLLGAVFSGGDGQEQHIEFAAGRAEISPEGMEMLTEFARVLYDRPAIRVELTGRIDPEKDGGALTGIRFGRLLKTEKLKELARKKKAAGIDVDAVEITAEEHEHYLEKAYKAADFERPRNFLGMLKDIPAEEMEQLLYDHIVITDDDLRNLALKRAAAVRDVLVREGPVEGERIFVVEPKGGYGEAGGEPAGMRVDISVR